ncbi:MAG: sirohydrochlorin cobaltochelatase [Desulfotomaculum sp.]|nr:sirohydrochlorin cobaltochelatase [Desulfotomaculum sp.]
MKSIIRLGLLLLLFLFLVGCYAENDIRGKKAILVVSFGTSYPEARKSCIESVENKIRSTFKDYEVRRAFTSDFIIKKLKERDGISVDNPDTALKKLKEEGYEEVIVQPLHIIPGSEYEEIKDVVNHYINEKSFKKIVLGRPLLGSESSPNDYAVVLEALKEQIPDLAEDQAVVLMGHGSEHPANHCYAKLQEEIDKLGLNIFIGTVEAEPTLDDVKEKLKARRINKVILMPFMLVAGDHAKNDLAGNEESSWKMQLQDDYSVEIYLHGLGENKSIQNIYVQHVKDAIGMIKNN